MKGSAAAGQTAVNATATKRSVKDAMSFAEKSFMHQKERPVPYIYAAG